MSANDLIFLILVAGGAFYAGYQAGRFKALAELGAARRQPADGSPLPGPLDRPYPEPSAAPSHPRAAPPPASAGDNGSWPEAGASPSGRASPQRSTKPPPAAAGLMGTGEAGTPGGKPK